jgi:hypothetical protein
VIMHRDSLQISTPIGLIRNDPGCEPMELQGIDVEDMVDNTQLEMDATTLPSRIVALPVSGLENIIKPLGIVEPGCIIATRQQPICMDDEFVYSEVEYIDVADIEEELAPRRIVVDRVWAGRGSACSCPGFRIRGGSLETTGDSPVL